ncbi:MAG TPA: hypothetical protein VGH73_19235 [Thermoanaerobaculia bacterium]|jgi:hypothetical protein
MKTHRLVLTLSLLVLALAVSVSAADTPGAASIQILTPADQAQLDAGASYPLDYQITLGPGDDHFHVWVDAERSPGIHDLKGTYMLPKMTPGVHVITLKLVDKGHVPTGPQTSIQVTVK